MRQPSSVKKHHKSVCNYEKWWMARKARRKKNTTEWRKPILFFLTSNFFTSSGFEINFKASVVGGPVPYSRLHFALPHLHPCTSASFAKNAFYLPQTSTPIRVLSLYKLTRWRGFQRGSMVNCSAGIAISDSCSAQGGEVLGCQGRGHSMHLNFL